MAHPAPYEHIVNFSDTLSEISRILTPDPWSTISFAAAVVLGCLWVPVIPQMLPSMQVGFVGLRFVVHGLTANQSLPSLVDQDVSNGRRSRCSHLPLAA